MLQRAIAACRACPSMKPWRRFGVEAYGDGATGYLLVGEAPGYVSWRNRRRFTGPAGLLIRRALRHVGHPRYRDLEDLFYMTDAVKCHPAPPHNPASNRSPSRGELAACSGFLADELRVLRPAAIVTFGKTAAEAVARALDTAKAAGLGGRVPEVLSFPHPSPRNRVAIRKQYPTMQAFEETLAATFRRLIAGLEQAGGAPRVPRPGSR